MLQNCCQIWVITVREPYWWGRWVRFCNVAVQYEHRVQAAQLCRHYQKLAVQLIQIPSDNAELLVVLCRRWPPVMSSEPWALTRTSSFHVRQEIIGRGAEPRKVITAATALQGWSGLWFPALPLAPRQEASRDGGCQRIDRQRLPLYLLTNAFSSLMLKEKLS